MTTINDNSLVVLQTVITPSLTVTTYYDNDELSYELGCYVVPNNVPSPKGTIFTIINCTVNSKLVIEYGDRITLLNSYDNFSLQCQDNIISDSCQANFIGNCGDASYVFNVLPGPGNKKTSGEPVLYGDTVNLLNMETNAFLGLFKPTDMQTYGVVSANYEGYTALNFVSPRIGDILPMVPSTASTLPVIISIKNCCKCHKNF